MSKPPPTKLRNAIKAEIMRLNNLYGKGDVGHVDFRKWRVHLLIHYAGPRNPPTIEKRKYRWDATTSTLYFLGHSKVVK